MTADNQLPKVVEGEVIDLDALLNPTSPQHLPAVRTVCACGKNGTPEAHGYNPATGHRALTCTEVLELAGRVNADLARRPSLASRLVRRIEGRCRR